MGETLKFESRYRLLPSMSREYAKHVFCKSTRILGGIIMLVSAAALIISVVWADYRLSDTTIFILCFTGGLRYMYWKSGKIKPFWYQKTALSLENQQILRHL